MVKLARTVREKARAAVDLLPPIVAEPLFRQQLDLESFFEEVGATISVTPRQAETLVTSLYRRLEAIQEKLSAAGVPAIVRRRALSALREAVVDLELLLIPERERDLALLGVKRSDDVAAVKTKFRALARKHHPDIHGGDTKRMEQLNRAYRNVTRMRGGRT